MTASGYIETATHLRIVAEDLATEQATSSPTHETTHLDMRHIDDLEDYRAQLGRMEVEAESVALLAAGLPASTRARIAWLDYWMGERTRHSH